jgi:hypothetical protein
MLKWLKNRLASERPGSKTQKVIVWRAKEQQAEFAKNGFTIALVKNAGPWIELETEVIILNAYKLIPKRPYRVEITLYLDQVEALHAVLDEILKRQRNGELRPTEDEIPF